MNSDSMIGRRSEASREIRREIHMIGAPFALGQPHSGVVRAPGFLRESEFFNSFTRFWNRGFQDRGDLFQPIAPRENSGDLALISSYCEKIADAVEGEARKRRFPLLIGGDHSVALGSITGMLRRHPDLVVVWVDAHADINTFETSPTGNFHGMPLAGLLDQFDPDSQKHFPWRNARLSSDRVILIGIRDLDPGEIEIIEKLKIRTIPMNQLRKNGLPWAIKELQTFLSSADRRNSPIHLSFDLDGLDPSVAPATGTPASGGLTEEEGIEICRLLGRTERMASMDLVEFNPLIVPFQGADTLTAKIAVSLIESACSGILKNSVKQPERIRIPPRSFELISELPFSPISFDSA